MNDSAVAIRDLLKGPGRGPSAPDGAGVAETNAERPFSNARIGDRPQVTLVFRKKDGPVRGFSYVLFLGIESDNPAEGFSIEFSQVRVTITGRNLEPLFKLVCAHRVAEIRESDQTQTFGAGELEPVVDRIDFRSQKGGESSAKAK